jgi:hypothetical protein
MFADWLVGRSPPRLHSCINPFLSVLSFVLLLLLWILAAVLLILMTGTADFCFTADANVLDVTNTENDNVVSFFVRCDEDATLVNPFASYGGRMPSASPYPPRARELIRACRLGRLQT